MVVSKFSENFWGEKINGFDILTQNLKHSLQNVKDLETYFRECESIEDTYSKLLTKLSAQVNRFSTNGTFYPAWSPIKELNERLANAHTQIVHQIRDIIKETKRYHEDLNKKMKRILDNESQTQASVQSFLEISQALNKTKEQYHTCALELEKQKRAENTNVQKLEKKVKQAYDEYKLNVDKYNSLRNDYERKFNDSSTHLQLGEELHLKQIKQLIDSYTKIFINNNHVIKQVFDEFQVKIEPLSSDVLIQIFIDNKRTGSERPEAVTLIEPDFSKLPAAVISQQPTTNALFNPNSSVNSSNSGGGGGGGNSINSYNALADNDFNLFLNPNIPVPTNHNNNNNVNNSPFNANIANSMVNGHAGTSGVNNNQTSGAATSASTANVNPTNTSNDNMKRSDSRGLNIFNIDILSRNKGKSKKASTADKTSVKNKKKSNSTNQLLQHHPQTPPTPSIQRDLMNLKDTNSINSDDLINSMNINDSISMNNNNVTGHASRQPQNLVNSSIDIFDQLNKNSNGNGSDVDSEGYSIRPDKSDVKKDTDDMNNFYNSSSTENDSDSEPEVSDSSHEAP